MIKIKAWLNKFSAKLMLLTLFDNFTRYPSKNSSYVPTINSKFVAIINKNS